MSDIHKVLSGLRPEAPSINEDTSGTLPAERLALLGEHAGSSAASTEVVSLVGFNPLTEDAAGMRKITDVFHSFVASSLTAPIASVSGSITGGSGVTVFPVENNSDWVTAISAELGAGQGRVVVSGSVDFSLYAPTSTYRLVDIRLLIDGTEVSGATQVSIATDSEDADESSLTWDANSYYHDLAHLPNHLLELQFKFQGNGDGSVYFENAEFDVTPIQLPGTHYGAWQSDQDFTIASTTTAYVLTLNTIDYEDGFSIVDNSKITAEYAGIYNLQWSAQFENVAAADHDAYVWLRKNGTDVVGSTGLISVPAKHGTIPGHTIAGWNYVIELAAGDYLQLWWAADSTDVSIQHYAAGSTPTTPTTASLIATIVPVVAGGGSIDPSTIKASDLATIFVPVFVAETGQVILDENGYPVMAEIDNP